MVGRTFWGKKELHIKFRERGKKDSYTPKKKKEVMREKEASKRRKVGEKRSRWQGRCCGRASRGIKAAGEGKGEAGRTNCGK